MKICYIDEAGCTGHLPTSTSDVQPVLAFCGFILDAAHLKDATIRLIDAKRKFFPGLAPGSTKLGWILKEVKGSDQYKTAFVLAHKLREAMAAEDKGAKVQGQVEIDGMYAGGYVKPANYKEHRRDRRLLANQSGKRQSVIVARERDGKTITFVAKSEAAAVEKLRDKIAEGSTVYADEASHWDEFHGWYDTKRINHSRAYSDGTGCTNQAESFFSRLRRAEIGTHHHIAGPYLASYAAEMDWREDRRRISNGEQFTAIVTAAAKHPVSRTWKGYWQRGGA